MQNVLATGKGEKGPVGARLHMILARKAHTAVIFRRGPSKWVQLIKWNTDTDDFDLGQWFHGRIYERRCDLSPEGSLLVYFAQKISARTMKDKEYTYAWTAISKPPYLTALALWPKGDCSDGGGLFHSDKALALYHLDAANPHPNHKPPSWLHVTLSGRGRGEDDPIFSDRLDRDGWALKQEWNREYLGPPKWIQTTQAEVRERTSRNRKFTLRLTRSIKRLDYSEEFSVIRRKDADATVIPRATWADWDHNGRLVFCRDGKVFAARLDDDARFGETQLADFNPSKPRPLPPPPEATRW